MWSIKMNSDSEKKKILFIFGAGASYDAGAPIQDKIFQYYFEKSNPSMGYEKLKDFFQKIFGVKEFSDFNEYSTFPTFEEVLGILEFAVQNSASLGQDFPIEKIRKMKELVINLMAVTIKESLEMPKNNNHKILIEKLFKNNEFKYSFINLNYDILLDKALIGLYEEYYLDYGIDFWRNYLDETWSKPRDPKVYLLKPHGSLNWFYCPSCNSIYLNVAGKPKFRHTEIEPLIPKCEYCNSKQTLFIIPPTFFKTLTNLHIATILQKIQKEVVNSDYLIFIGYSFPDADLHLKYIIKKAFQFRPKSRKVIVIEKESKDGHDSKLLDTYLRYERIFKEIYFIPIGFEKFVKSPFKYLKRPERYIIKTEELDINT